MALNLLILEARLQWQVAQKNGAQNVKRPEDLLEKKAIDVV